jgi:hypothetical protein
VRRVDPEPVHVVVANAELGVLDRPLAHAALAVVDRVTRSGSLADRVALEGERIALGQTLLKLTVPGVPDIYQGDELWSLSLGDPDNRRPVDWSSRRRLLQEFIRGVLVAAREGFRSAGAERERPPDGVQLGRLPPRGRAPDGVDRTVEGRAGPVATEAPFPGLPWLSVGRSASSEAALADRDSVDATRR